MNQETPKNLDDEILEAFDGIRKSLFDLTFSINHDEISQIEARYKMLSDEIIEIEKSIEDASLRYVSFLRSDMLDGDFEKVKKDVVSFIEEIEERIIGCSIKVLQLKK